jgi:orotate phosphoribosyltransferase
MEIGISSFAETTPDPVTGAVMGLAQRLREVVEEIELADQVGLDVYGLGEHHRADYASSAPAVALAAAASLASRLPFLIVRKEAKDYSTGRRVEGAFAPGEHVCVVEDVVTTGGALLAAVEALRAEGLECRHAVCVVDREEGGSDVLARHAVRLSPLFRARDIAGAPKAAAKPHD